MSAFCDPLRPPREKCIFLSNEITVTVSMEDMEGAVPLAMCSPFGAEHPFDGVKASAFGIQVSGVGRRASVKES
jgi:hypothetical protein